ncbi:MAG: right-handed parallel beta-helix repeat-containing protein, partial [Sedimentisphaerales bacterium]|nr:right-handed parallel beta-helix repeat-containing protein [Sedimentisphaerales bacterium]
YRTGGLRLNQGITIQPYRDEQPVCKGTRVADQWRRGRGGLWTTSWDSLFPEKPDDWWVRESNARTTPLHRFNNDMVFVDGRFLQSAGWGGELDDTTFFIDYDQGQVYLSIDPTDKLVEITAFDSALTRTTEECHGKTSDGKGPVIRGITFTQYAFRALEFEGYYPQGLSAESEHGNDVVGSTIEHCTITFCSRVAGYFKGNKLTIRHCLVSDTSTEGIYIISSNDILLEKNIFRRNNIEDVRGYFPAAVKIFNQCYRAICRDNLIIDHPNSNGIWYDVGNVDGVIVDNWFQDIGVSRQPDRVGRGYQPGRNAFFFEISKGAICAGNVFVNCDCGIFVLNSSNVEMYQNTFVNSLAHIMRDSRSAVGDHFGWHPSTGPDVNERYGHVFVNNLLTGDENYTGSLLELSQRRIPCEQFNQPQVKQLDYNVYVRRADTSEPLIQWSPADAPRCRVELDSPADLHNIYPDFAAHSLSFTSYPGPLFQSPALKNYRLLPTFPAAKTATQLPIDVCKRLGWPENTPPYTGAYPTLK